MKFNRVYAIVLRQFYLIRGSFTRVIPLFAWVAIDMVLWGFITKFLNNVTSLGSGATSLNFVPTLLGAVLLWDFLTRVMQGVTMAFFEDVWSRNFLNVFASPLSIREYLSGLVVSSLLTSSIGLSVMLIVAGIFFGLSFYSYGFLFAGFVFVLFLFGIALGIFATAIVLRLGPASEWFVWPIPALLSPFAGVFYPLSTLPEWMQWISKLLPPSYVFENLRALVTGGQASQSSLVIGLAIASFELLLACYFFARTHRFAVRTGLIARYSAETVS